MYKIRLATIKDLKSIQKLNTLVFADNIKWDSDAVENYSNTPQGEKYYASALKNSNGCFFICEENGNFLGYANGVDMEVDYRKSKYFEIVNIGVHPATRGLGIGKALLDEITKWAKEKGFEKIYLNCYAKNTGALDFYKKNGFEEIDICLEKSI